MGKEFRINEDRLLGTFLDLVRVNSPSFNEREIGDLLCGMLRGAGCEVTVQDYGRSFNIVGRKGGTEGAGRPLILSGHMDTVEPTQGIRCEVDNGIVRSVGETILGADDKSALAMIIEALTVLREQDLPHGDIEVVFTSAEEKGLFGARHLDFGMLRSRHALVLDSGGPVGKIVTAAPTHHTYEMNIRGRAAHAGIEPEKGINAIRVAARIIEQAPPGKIDDRTTSNVGLISGGSATNVVPEQVEIQGEFRSHDETRLEKLKKDFFTAARHICGQEGAAVSIVEHEEYRRFSIDGGDPFVRFLKDIFSDCGIDHEEVVSCGGSDANIFNEKGIKTLNLSTGMENVHSKKEFIRIEDLCNGCRVLLAALGSSKLL